MVRREGIRWECSCVVGGTVEVAWPNRGGVVSMQALPKPRCGEGWKVDGLGTTLKGSL